MINTIKNRPEKLLIALSLIFGGIGVAIWKYDKIVGYSFRDQGEIEKFFRLIFGSMIIFIPIFLIYALIYWLMYKFKRPMNPILNLWHIGLLFLTILTNLSASVSILFNDSIDFNHEMSTMDYLLSIVSLAVPVIFIINIIQSLLKYRKGKLLKNNNDQSTQ